MPPAPPKCCYVCTDCGTVDIPKTVTRGSIGVEIILWLAFLLPGLLYSAWRMSARYKACKVCESRNIVPGRSPRGLELYRQRYGKWISR